MKTNNSGRQFVMDGLIGVIVALLLGGILAYPIAFASMGGSGSFLDVIGWMVTDPDISTLLISIILTAFISVGIGGRFLEAIPSRLHWIVRLLPIVGISWLMGLVLFTIIAVRDRMAYFAIRLLYYALPSLVGPIISLLIGGLAGIIFNPQKRLNKMIIGAIATLITMILILGIIGISGSQ